MPIEELSNGLRLLVNGKSRSNLCVSATLASPRGLLIATASIDFIDLDPPRWWVSRVFVHSQWRGQGHGSVVLDRALREVARDAGDSTHIVEVWVEPGGYDVDEARQRDFYIQRGFEPRKVEGDEEVLVWRAPPATLG